MKDSKQPETNSEKSLENRERERQELDRIAKMMVKRDFELMELKDEREAELKELRKVKKELEDITANLEKKVQERTQELQKKVEELERMNNLMVNRELKMVELKNEIEQLKEKQTED
ncbi:hypothetical protein KKC60_02465 [Patescibacteria group bacterium]|nr:hypothetical protein [Patescibacteria group bacterium]